MYLYYILPDQTVIQHYFDWRRGIWRTRVMSTCITFCWIRELFNTILIGPMAFGGRELCVTVSHSAGPDIYLLLL